MDFEHVYIVLFMDEPERIINTKLEIEKGKEDIDKEYAVKSHGGSKTPWIILGLAIALIIIFVIIVLIYFFVFNPPAMHNIIVTNNCSQTINVLFGVFTSDNGLVFLPVLSLEPTQMHLYQATPGSFLLIQGYRNGDEVYIGYLNNFTTVELILAGQGFGGRSQITDGINIIDNLAVFSSAKDSYAVSIQGGYNINRI